MKKIRNILLTILLRVYGRMSYGRLSEKRVSTLFNRLARDEGFEDFPKLLEDLADIQKDLYLYTGEEQHKGGVLALNHLRAEILLRKNLTKNKKKGIVKGKY